MPTDNIVESALSDLFRAVSTTPHTRAFAAMDDARRGSFIYAQCAQAELS